MRIAVVMSGHMRSYRHCAPTLFRHVLAGHEADFFIHTWPTVGFRANHTWDAHDVPLDELDVWRTYRPRVLVVQGQDEPGEVFPSPCAMFRRMYLANELRKEYELAVGGGYQYVLRCRPDLEFSGPIPWCQELTIPSGEDHAGTNDQLAWGNPHEIQRYFDVGKSPTEQHPETQLRDHLNSTGGQPRRDQVLYRIVRTGDHYISHLVGH